MREGKCTMTQLKTRLLLATAVCVMPAAPVQAQSGDVAVENDTIIVTARRVEESIQDVPISITVFDQETLSNNNVTSAADLGNYTPGLSTNSKFGTDNTTFSIRGFFQELRTTPSVGVFFADVVAPRSAASAAQGDGAGPGDFFDLQNVQVLKGPQGTLFGRNTTGGSVLLVPQKPKDKFEGFVEGTYGNYDQRRLSGVVNVPLNESIRIRAGVDWNKRDGYLKNITDIGPKRFANTDYWAARLSVVIDVTPDIENYTIASYSRSQTNGFSGHAESAIPGANDYFSMAQLQLDREAGNGVYEIANRLADAGSDLKTWRVINTTSWQASDTIEVKNIVSYAEQSKELSIDPWGAHFLLGATYTYLDRSLLGQPVNPFVTVATGQYEGLLVPFARVHNVPGGDLSDQSTFTEELRFSGTSFGNNLRWQFGGYYENSKPLSASGTLGYSGMYCEEPLETLQCTDVLSILKGIPQGSTGNIELNYKRQAFESIGIYGQGTLSLTNWLDFTAGARYTWDKTTARYWRYGVRFPAPNTPVVTCGDGLATPAGLDFAAAQARQGCEQYDKVKSSAPTWTLSLEARPNDDLMAFVKYSRGYRQGSVIPNSLPGFKTYDDEKVDVYEIGLRASGYVFAGPAYANITGYYNDFTNQQVQAGALVPGLAPNAVILNAGSSRMYGFELEAGIEPVDNLKFKASYAYLDTKLKAINLPGVQTPGSLIGFPFDIWDLQSNGPFTGPFIFPTSVAGQGLPLSPKHQLVITGDYTLPLPEEVGRVSIGATYSYTSSQVFTYSNFPEGRFDPRNLVNANLTWKGIAGSPVDATFFVTNLFKDKHIVVVNEQTSLGFISRNYNEPRMYGLKLRFNFGE